MKKKPAVLFAIMLILSMIMTACAPAASPSPVSMGYESENSVRTAPEAAADGMGQKAVAPGAPSEFSQAEATQRLVIRNATLGIVVKDPGASMDAIARMAEEMDGYVVSSTLSKYTTSDGIELPQAQIVVRVPADKLNQAMDSIKALVENKGEDILNENISGQDVTKDYTDQTSRLTNLENAEKQLQKILEETTKTDDVLNVYNQLVSIREQIELTKGQIKYYEESAALSSISVSLAAQDSIKPIAIGGWQPVGVARDAVQALINTMQFLGSALIWIIIFFVPIGFVIFLFILVLRFIFRKIFKPRPKQVQSTPQVPPTQPQQ
jgi:hypothetical protein